MNARLEGSSAAASLAAGLLLSPLPAAAQEGDALAKAAQNPVAAMISLPFQNNTFFGVGPHGDVANVLNIQPVVPLTFGEWNIISRTIVPVIYVQDLAPGLSDIANDPQGSDGSFGLGDINQTFYFSPVASGPVIWGIGPPISAPIVTANREADGDDTWTVPVGGGMGRIFHVGGQAMNASAQAFHKVESPQYGPDWSMRFQLQLVFQK